MDINYFTILYWFCHTSTWICHRCTRGKVLLSSDWFQNFFLDFLQSKIRSSYVVALAFILDGILRAWIWIWGLVSDTNLGKISVIIVLYISSGYFFLLLLIFPLHVCYIFCSCPQFIDILFCFWFCPQYFFLFAF